MQLRCIWRDPQADITGLGVEVGAPGAAAGAAFLATLPAEGYRCSDADGGRLCQRIRQNPQYPVVDGDTVLLRDRIVISIDQSNEPTNDLMGAIAKRIWG